MRNAPAICGRYGRRHVSGPASCRFKVPSYSPKICLISSRSSSARVTVEVMGRTSLQEYDAQGVLEAQNTQRIVATLLHVE